MSSFNSFWRHQQIQKGKCFSVQLCKLSEDTEKLNTSLKSRMKWCMDSNRPLQSSKNPHFQNEAKCTTFLVKMSFIYFLNVLYFSFDWLCHFKRLFIPVWREIHRSKILPVTSWQLTNRIVIFHAASDTAYVNHFFPSEFIIWFKSIQAKPVDLQTSSLAHF